MIKIDSKKEKVQLVGESNVLVEEIGVATAALLKSAANVNEETFTEHASAILLQTFAAIHKYEKRYHFKDTLGFIIDKLKEVE